MAEMRLPHKNRPSARKPTHSARSTRLLALRVAFSIRLALCRPCLHLRPVELDLGDFGRAEVDRGRRDLSCRRDASFFFRWDRFGGFMEPTNWLFCRRSLKNIISDPARASRALYAI